MNRVYKWGILAVLVYSLLTAFLFLYAKSCTEAFCGIASVLAGMPWMLFLDLVGGDSYNAGVLGWLSIVANCAALYFIFAALERRLRIMKKSQQK